MPGPNTVLRRHARKMVYDVYCSMEKEAQSEKETVKRTAEATKTSERTVRRIVKEGRNSEFLTVFRTPGKKRNRVKPITEINTFDQAVVRRCIHNYHITNKELPTVEKLRKKLKDDINFNGSERSLRRIINNLGFRWKKADNNRKILIEKSNIRLLRIEFLKSIIKYREEGRPIIYTDESYVDSTHSGSKAWSDESSKGLKNPISKGQRIVMVHAGSEAGFVPNALLLFKAGTKSGDYHDKMNYNNNYTKWLHTQLIPNLPPNAVVVIDDASYHNKQYDPAPTSNAKKADMQKWLAEKGIAYDEGMLKPELYKLIKLYKSQHKKYSIDQILAEHSHSVLRLPPYHPDLSPIEMAWAAIKGYVANKNVAWNVTRVMELVKEKVALMGADEWSKLCNEVKKQEAEYINSDHIVDTVTESLFIYTGDDSNSSSDESEDSSFDVPSADYSTISEPMVEVWLDDGPVQESQATTPPASADIQPAEIQSASVNMLGRAQPSTGPIRRAQLKRQFPADEKAPRWAYDIESRRVAAEESQAAAVEGLIKAVQENTNEVTQGLQEIARQQANCIEAVTQGLQKIARQQANSTVALDNILRAINQR